MSTTDTPLSLWERTSNWLIRIAEAIDYDSVQFTFDQMNEMDKELIALKTRVEQLEKESLTESSLSDQQLVISSTNPAGLKLATN